MKNILVIIMILTSAMSFADKKKTATDKTATTQENPSIEGIYEITAKRIKIQVNADGTCQRKAGVRINGTWEFTSPDTVKFTYSNKTESKWFRKNGNWYIKGELGAIPLKRLTPYKAGSEKIKEDPSSAFKLPELYKKRSRKGKMKALKNFGGSENTEKTVLKALRWLKENQNKDGSWGEVKESDFSAYTGFALLAFLAHGETPASVEFGDTVQKAINRLVEYTGPIADKLKGGYRHSIVTYALTEAYGMTRDPSLKSVVTKAITRIIQSMNSCGSYNYGYVNKPGSTGIPRSDLSVAGWNYQALEAALTAGVEVEGLKEAIKKAKDTGLKKTHWNDKAKMFSYGANGAGPKPSMTAVGVLCLNLFGERRSKEAMKGLTTLQNKKCFWVSWDKNPVADQPPAWALFQWYYQTMAIFLAQNGKGGKWKQWNKMLTTELIKRQKEDGSWVTPAYADDSEQARNGENMFKGLDQQVYATSLCCLMLEVYYRYIP